MIEKKFLSIEWFYAVSSQSKISIPEYVMDVLEIFKPMTDLSIDDYKSKNEFDYKEDGSPAGKADLEIELLFKNHIKQKYNHHYIKGEEAGDETPKNPIEGDNRWVIDPVDGTRNNEYGRDDFAISIAHQIFEGGQWKSHNAILILPVKGEALWASKNNGSFILNYNRALTETPLIQPLSIDRTEGARPLKKSLVDLSTKPFSPQQEGGLIESLRNDGITHRTTGSAAIAVAQTGLKNDGSIVLAYDYDVTAGALIAKEAGCHTSEFLHETDRALLTLIVAGKSEAIHEALESKCRTLLGLKPS